MPDSNDLPAILLITASSLTTRSLNRLIGEQFSIVHAESAEQAWQVLQSEAIIKVVICELEMAINEMALLERVRRAEDKVVASLPVLLLVGESDTEERMDLAFSVGATDFIHMPFSSIELMARVRLHSKLFSLHQKETSFELDSQNSPVDILNSLMQEKYFSNRLEQELSFSARHKSFVSVCLIKLDGADELEEKYSKDILKAVLRAVAKIIEKMIRREDSYAYFGDETFALLYPVTNGIGANTATKRLVEEIHNTLLNHQQQSIKVSLSAGLYSTLPTEELSTERVLSIIEQRLKKAEKKGGGQIVSSKSELEQNKVSIEQALNMINFNRTESLVKQIPGLLDGIMPLLEFIHTNDEMQFNRILDKFDDEPG
ncbi:MAG: diguanylate cyclase [Gammaproteobacteria bacterium]|nr:diguanylate cyclase [Gammaproteobacteria bacterium]